MVDDTLVKLEDLIPPDYHIRPGYYLKDGWELFKQNAWGFIGFSVVALIVALALNTMAGLGPGFLAGHGTKPQNGAPSFF